MNYHKKKFRPISNSENGEVSDDMIFFYSQEGNVLTCIYNGANIIKGQLIGLVDTEGRIEMRYHQVNRNGELMTGICQSTPETLENGKIRLHERWRWTSGDGTAGESILEEI
ncbi:n-acetylglutamate synthase [Cryomorphaceae bacterium 1068]|nr:n-acetylglutamate synthase [Cryomorphaceae bacterium 1068]